MSDGGLVEIWDTTSKSALLWRADFVLVDLVGCRQNFLSKSTPLSSGKGWISEISIIKFCSDENYFVLQAPFYLRFPPLTSFTITSSEGLNKRRLPSSIIISCVFLLIISRNLKLVVSYFSCPLKHLIGKPDCLYKKLE